MKLSKIRSAVQVSPRPLHADRTPLLQASHGCNGHATPSHRNNHKLKEASAIKQRIFVGCWLSVLFGFGSPAFAQQRSNVFPDPVLQSAPSLEQASDNQRLKRYSLEPPSRTAPPPTYTTNPSPLPAACENTIADPKDRIWQIEWATGKKQAAVLERRMTLIVEPAITEYLNHLEQAIVRSSHLRGCFVVKLVNDGETNAYSLPGGFLYVTTGLILNSANEAELVGALAHETGHVTARHHTKIEARRQIWRRLSVAAGPAGYVLRWPLGSLFTQKLSRNAEFEADGLALKYESASGYDPIEIAHLLQDAFAQEGEPTSFLTRLFDAHPSTDSRIKRVAQATGCHFQPETGYVVDTSEFHEVKRHVADVLGVTNHRLVPEKERLAAEAHSGWHKNPVDLHFCR
jgi:peptidase M48-like protein